MNRMMAGLKDCKALVIDPVPTSRSVLTAQLRDFGLGSVTQCGRQIEATRLLEARAYDIVLCEMDFQADGGSARGGQEFLEELRHMNRLPLATVFIMVTGERGYAKVAEAAESALDSYLLKPFTAKELATRLVQARHRKTVLKDIFDAIDRGDFAAAAQSCVASFHARGRYWLYAARLGAELLLNLRQFEAAQQLLDAVVTAQALPWARLGLAKVQLETAQRARALCTLETLILEEPGFADAYDVMGRARLAQGEFDDALDIYRQAAELTPGSVRRQQALGLLAFYNGDSATASRALERAWVMGKGSRSFDHQVLVLLAAGHFRSGDSRALQRCRADLQLAVEGSPGALRLARMLAVVEVFELMVQRQVAKVIGALKVQAAEIRAPDFDVEAACNLLMLLAQLTAAELNLPDAEDWVRATALRFCGSRASSETLARSAGAHPPYAALVRACHAEVQSASQKALTHSIQGDPGAALQALLDQAGRTLNLKFHDTAQGVLQRYGHCIADAEPLRQQLQALHRQMGVANEQVAAPLDGRLRRAG